MKKLLFLLPILLYAQIIDTVIPLFDEPRERFLYIPEGNKLYVNLDQSRRLLVLDCSTYAIRKIIQIPPSFPCAAYGLWNPRRNKIYYIFNEGPDSIAVIDNRNDSIIKWINYDSYTPMAMAYNSKIDKIYTTANGSLAIIDCATDSIVKIIPPSPYPFGAFVLWDSIGDKVYTGCWEWGSDKVIVLNCANDSVIAIINTMVTGPCQAVYNTQRRKIYVAGDRGRTGAVIDAIGDTLIKNLYPISFAWEFQLLIWNSLEDKVYWPGYYDLYIIDCQTDSIIKTINPPYIFDGFRLNHLSNRLYIASQDTVGTGYWHILLKILDCHNDSVISQIRFGRLGMGMEYDPINQRIYIGDVIDSALYVIRDEMPGIEELKTFDAKRVTLNIYPNPAKREVRIAYSLPNRGKAELVICDISGKIITKTTEEKDAGHYEFLWQGKDQKGKVIPNGIYFLRLKAGNNLQTQKIILTR